MHGDLEVAKTEEQEGIVNLDGDVSDVMTGLGADNHGAYMDAPVEVQDYSPNDMIGNGQQPDLELDNGLEIEQNENNGENEEDDDFDGPAER